MIETIIALVVLFLFVIVMHEWGHVMVFQELGRDVKVTFKRGTFQVGTPTDYKGIPTKKKQEIYERGFILGLIPIIIASFLIGWVFIFLIVPYLLWSSSDIKQIWRLRG